MSLCSGGLARIQVMVSPCISWGFEMKFYEVGLSVLCPTTSNPGGPVGCFFGFSPQICRAWGRPTSSCATVSIAWWIMEAYKLCHHLSRSCNP